MNLFIEIPCAPHGAAQDELLFVESLRSYLELNYSNYSFNVSEFARSMKMSTAHFNRKVNKLTGYSPAKLIIEYRLRVAVQLLASCNEPVKIIAGLVGFSAHTSFCRSFLQTFGMSPSAYKQHYSSHNKNAVNVWRIPINMREAEYLLEHATRLTWFRELLKAAVFSPFSESVSVTELAAILYFTPSSLSRKLKQICPISIHKFIRDLKLQYAAELLQTESYISIEEVAITVGFFDHAHFCHCFKKAFGVVPSSYRLKGNDDMAVLWLKKQLMIENVK